MKRTILVIVAILVYAITFGQSQTYVRGYTRSNGTYVEGHYRTSSNYTKNDNWSTSGNTNPYTGAQGTKPGDYNVNYSTQTYSNYPSNNSYNTYNTYNTPSTYSTHTPSSYSTYSAPSTSTYNTVYYSSSCNCYITK